MFEYIESATTYNNIEKVSILGEYEICNCSYIPYLNDNFEKLRSNRGLEKLILQEYSPALEIVGKSQIFPTTCEPL